MSVNNISMWTRKLRYQFIPPWVGKPQTRDLWFCWPSTNKQNKTTTLHLHHAFLYISLPSFHDYNVKLPNFTFCSEREQKTTTFFFFSWTLTQSFRIQLHIWRIKLDGISAIKFEAAQIHFSSDVSVAVAVVVTLTPYCLLKRSTIC